MKTHTLKGIYLTDEVRYQLKSIKDRYHTTFKRLIPAILHQIVSNDDSVIYTGMPVSSDNKYLKNITISPDMYDRLKLMANKRHLLFNDFLNSAIIATLTYCNMDSVVANHIHIIDQEIAPNSPLPLNMEAVSFRWRSRFDWRPATCYQINCIYYNVNGATHLRLSIGVHHSHINQV